MTARKYGIEVTLAVIAAIGAAIVAAITNVDKFNSLQEEQPTGVYVETDDLETEIRHHVELTGLRQAMQAMKTRLEGKYKEKYKLSDAEVSCIMDTSFFGNEYIDVIVDAHKRHLTLQEVQELNRFYASSAMVGYRRKQDAILQDVMDQFDRLTKRKYETFKRLTDSSMAKDSRNTGSCPSQ